MKNRIIQDTLDDGWRRTDNLQPKNWDDIDPYSALKEDNQHYKDYLWGMIQECQKRIQTDENVTTVRER